MPGKPSGRCWTLFLPVLLMCIAEFSPFPRLHHSCPGARYTSITLPRQPAAISSYSLSLSNFSFIPFLSRQSHVAHLSPFSGSLTPSPPPLDSSESSADSQLSLQASLSFRSTGTSQDQNALGMRRRD